MIEPATLAQAARARLDIVSGETMDEARLIRFVQDPAGSIVPDMARKLPGRGVWVAATRPSLERAVRNGLFARAIKKKVLVSPSLAEQVEDLMLKRLLAGLGLARKAGSIVVGFEKARSAIVAGNAAFVIEAIDGSSDGRRKLFDALHRSLSPPRIVGLFTSLELSLALGAENVVHSVFLVGRGAERWSNEIERLSGFRRLIPEDWVF